jgi:hypothetical protein
VRDPGTKAKRTEGANPLLGFFCIISGGGLNVKLNPVFYHTSFDAISKSDDVHWFIIIVVSLKPFRFIVSTHDLVPIELIGVRHRSTRSTIATLYITYSPAHLSFWVGSPVSSHLSHLSTWQ